MKWDYRKPMKYRFTTECPRCRKTSEVITDTAKLPKVHCGDCLINDVEIVQMTTNLAEIAHD